jgi:hypothetical protein
MQPYIVPIYHAYRDHCIYSFSEPGQKIDWMRANPLVCVEADQMRREQWTTVVVFGRYEELCDTPEFRSERSFGSEDSLFGIQPSVLQHGPSPVEALALVDSELQVGQRVAVSPAVKVERRVRVQLERRAAKAEL